MDNEETCYAPYVSAKKDCPNTTDDPEKVTCMMCMIKLRKTGKYEIKLVKK